MSISETQKKRGRPATGETPQVRFRLPEPLIDAIDRYADEQKVTRSEAIRVVLTAWLSEHRYYI